MIDFIKNFLNFIYKKRCFCCGSTKDNSFICKDCLNSLSFFSTEKIIEIDGVKIFSAFLYKDKIKKLIHLLKYKNKREIAFFLGNLLYKFYCETPLKDIDFIVTVVPLHKKRLKKRKYNQVELITDEFLKNIHLQKDYSLIERVKNTIPQYSLTKKEREENIKGCFLVTKSDLKEKNILLIDDIITTGTTLQEIIKMFKEKGYRNITVLTVSCSTFFE